MNILQFLTEQKNGEKRGLKQNNYERKIYGIWDRREIIRYKLVTLRASGRHKAKKSKKSRKTEQNAGL